MLGVVVVLGVVVLAAFGAAWVMDELEDLFQPPSEWGAADE